MEERRIETIARGICVKGGSVLICKGLKAGNLYFPGGHIEFGETGRYALEREIANSPLNGIPALCAVSAELSTQFSTLRETLLYNTSLDVKAELQKLQDTMQLQLDTK